MSKNLVRMVLFFLLIVVPLELYAETGPGAMVVYKADVLDLRIENNVQGLAQGRGKASKGYSDLTVGRVFLTEGGIARKVSAIYKQNGKNVIETVEPRFDEIFSYVNVPDFEVKLTRENFKNLGPGVTFDELPNNTRTPRDMFAVAKKDTSISVESTSSTPLAKATWFETDTRIEGKDSLVLRAKISIPVVSGKSPDGKKDLFKKFLKQYKDRKSVSTGGSDPDGVPNPPTGNEKTIDIIGVLRMTDPELRGGINWPTIEFEDVSIFGWFDIPLPVYKDGSAWASFEGAHQLDMSIGGTLHFTKEFEQILGHPMVMIPYTPLTFGVRLAARESFTGSLSLTIEASEYMYLYTKISADLAFPLIPVHPKIDTDFHFNTAFRPVLIASAELRAGLYLAPNISFAGLTLVAIEGGGGVYALADGFLEPMGVMGYDTSAGGYGNFRDIIASVKIETGAFATINAEVAGMKFNDLYLKRWPFWIYEGDNSLEFNL